MSSWGPAPKTPPGGAGQGAGQGEHGQLLKGARLGAAAAKVFVHLPCSAPAPSAAC